MGCEHSKVAPTSELKQVKSQISEKVIREELQPKRSKHDASYPETFSHYCQSAESLSFSRQFEYAPTYTIKEIADFNKNLGFIQIFPFRNMVCCASKFKKLVVKPVKEYERYKQEMYSINAKIKVIDFKKEFKVNPAFEIWSHGLKMDVIQNCLIKCKVADLRILNDREKWADEKSDVNLLYNDLKHHKLSEYEMEFLEILVRFEEKYRALKGVPCKITTKKPVTNMDPFPLPSNIETNQNLLRPWVESWENFDTQIPENGAWGMIESELIADENADQSNEDDQIELPDFIFTFEGEAAWEIMESDVIKHDITTGQQNKIWETRSRRKHFNDPKRMERRRKRLEKYFIEKYKLNCSYLDPFRDFTNLLQKHWDEFQKLCEDG